MLGLSGMYGNYESRKVSRTKFSEEFFISTARVSDREYSYETAIYKDDEWYIVSGTDSIDEAEKNHNSWVEKINNNSTLEIYDIFEGVNNILVVK